MGPFIRITSVVKMLSIPRITPRAHRVVSKGLYSGIQATRATPEFAAYVFGQGTISDNHNISMIDHDFLAVEGMQGEIRDLSITETRHALSQAMNYQHLDPSVQGVQGGMSGTGLTGLSSANFATQDAYNSVYDGLSSHVSMRGHMQSNVPSPQKSCDVSRGYGSYHNMPGSGERLLDKYLNGSRMALNGRRKFSTSAMSYISQQGAQERAAFEEEFLTDPTPQGVQGDNCVSFKLWMENCHRYNLPNCDEQLDSLKEGRKTLAQVFQEQQEIIRLVAEDYKTKNALRRKAHESSAQGQQDYFGYSFEFSASDPCPQGLQGDDCATYKVWAHNCKAFGFDDCSKKAFDVQTGKRSLQSVFDEQDGLIKKIVADYKQRRSYSTSSRTQEQEVRNENDKTSDQSCSIGSQEIPQNPQRIPPNNSSTNTNINQSSSEPADISQLSQTDRLKRAVKEYGSTVIVFHVCISLASLGGFYVAVSR